jgi:hypothetical protein
MKKIGRIILTILLVCSFLVTMAAADPTMRVSEQPTGIAVGDTFTAKVTVDPMGGEIYAAQYDLRFNTTILEATEQMQGDFLSQGGVETYTVLNTINNTLGKIEYGETRLGNQETVGGATATGVLASITFEVIGEGVSTLSLSDVLFDDLSEPTNGGGDENPDTGDSSHSSSSGSSRYTSITTPTTAPTETPIESAASPGSDSDAIEDRGTTHVSGETGSAIVESIPPSSESVPTASTAETPLRPESAIPGFAASLAIVGLFAVAIILKSRGE